MYIDFSSLFQQSSKDRSAQGRVQIPFDETLWPDDWKKVFCKTYPRLENIALPDGTRKGGLFDSIAARKSRRDFSGRVLNTKDISTILKYACGIVSTQEGEYHRAQASGGGRYPIETYLIVFAGTESVHPGVYHYAVQDNSVDVLWRRQFTKADIADLFTYPWAQEASMAVVLTGVFHRNQMKYGERGYRHVLIEAGSIIQNIYLVATTLGVKCCGIDGVHESNIEKLLDVDGITESALCSLVIG